MGEVCENHQSAKPYFRLISGEGIFGVFGLDAIYTTT